MNFDFVEIGTGPYHSLISTCADSEKGLSVEPLREYLDCWADRDNVLKIEAAVVADADQNPEKSAEIFYVDQHDIDRNQLGRWFKGCNFLGRPHDLHVQYYSDPNVWHQTADRASLPTRNLVDEGLVRTRRVKTFSVTEFIAAYSIEKIGFLKIDTDGLDCRIVNSFLDYYESRREFLPDRIMFESNSHSKPEEVSRLRRRLREQFGYEVNFDHHDTFANRKSHG